MEGTVLKSYAHSPASKWNILFEKLSEWICFKPQPGLRVYPCYACGNMFSTKSSFQDHVNRRILMILYKCVNCATTFTFYNRCSFILHARAHYSFFGGQINLTNVEIFPLPAGFMGFSPLPLLYNDEELLIESNVYVNSQFYNPEKTDKNNEIIIFKPRDVVFVSADQADQGLGLRQISSNVPLCEFVTLNTLRDLIKKNCQNSGLKKFTFPIISNGQILRKSEPTAEKLHRCPECWVVIKTPLSGHFLSINKPLDEKLKCSTCKYIAPTKCSLQAHIRLHDNIAPHVCPECGNAFSSGTLLREHMQSTCFHLTKQIRLRCAGSKCGKLFASTVTYSSHFKVHLDNLHQCSVCKTVFFKYIDFVNHASIHETCEPIQIFSCTVCKHTSEVINKNNIDEHISWHVKDRSRSLYVYCCKLCRSYFRSNATFAAHVLKCANKFDSAAGALCQISDDLFKKLTTKKIKTISGSLKLPQIENYAAFATKPGSNICLLCGKIRDSSHKCKYDRPIIVVERLRTVDGLRRKRKKLPTIQKNKKNSTESIDLQAEEPISFNGTYYCKLCNYVNASREQFHEHIITHRSSSTVFQCMECGECFVVKPTLIKHLMHYHKIKDTDSYLDGNNCFDKAAIEELETHLKLAPGEHKGPVKENQCTVCLKEFEDSLSLNKHFRMHGMAFLMKKVK